MEMSEDKIRAFSLWVFWTGVFNIVAYIWLACPYSMSLYMGLVNDINRFLHLGGTPLTLPRSVNDVLLINILGMIVVFLGIMLIVAALDLEKRAWFVLLEALIRIIAFLMLLYFAIFLNAARILVLFGLVDLLIGIIYLYYIFTIKALKVL